MRNLDTLQFVSMDIYLEEFKRSLALELLRNGFVVDELSWAVTPPRACYVPDLDLVALTDESIPDIVHELCERDMVNLIGYAELGNTYVSHIMSP